MPDLRPIQPPVACGTAQSTTDMLRRVNQTTLDFFDAVDRAAARFGASTGLVLAAWQVRMLDLFGSVVAQPTEASGRGVRRFAHETGLPVVGGGL